MRYVSTALCTLTCLLIALSQASAATAPDPLVVKEPFDSPDGTLLSNHHPNWSLVNGSDPATEGAIQQRQYQANAWTTHNYYFEGTSSGRARLTVIAGGDRRSTGPAVFMGAGNAGYAIGFGPPSSGNYAGINVFKDNLYVATPVQGGSWSVNQDRVLELRAREDSPPGETVLDIYVDGTLEGTYTDDNQPFSAGADGFRLGGNSPDASVVADWANTSKTNTTFNPNDGRYLAYGHWIQMNADDTTNDITEVCENYEGVRGIVRRFHWKALEVAFDDYAGFSLIESDLNSMSQTPACDGVAYVVFPLDKTFPYEDTNPMPPYLQGGDLDLRYNSAPDAYVSKRWHPFVANRLWRLYDALYAAFDDPQQFEHFAGAAVQESALSLSASQRKQHGYDADEYKQKLMDMLRCTAQSSTNARTFWYANYLAENQPYISDIIDVVGAPPFYVAVGGPDILPNSDSLNQHVYPRLQDAEGDTYLFNSAQLNSFDHQKDDGTYYRMQEIYEFGRDTLNLSQIVWNRILPQWAPHYDFTDVLPVIAAQSDVAELLITEFSGTVASGETLEVELAGETGLTQGNNRARVLSGSAQEWVGIYNVTPYSASVALGDISSLGNRLVLQIENGHRDEARIVLRDNASSSFACPYAN